MHESSGIIAGLISRLGYPGVFLWMLLESACVPIPSEIVMPYAGSLAAAGQTFNLTFLTVAGALGNLGGSILAYSLGAWKGRAFFERYGKFVLITRADLDTADGWFARHGEATVFFTRIVPLVRTFISLPAGIARMPFGRFCLFTLAGSVPWCFFLAWIGYTLGRHWTEIGPYFREADIGIVIAVGSLVGWWVWRRVRTLRIEGSSPPTGKPVD